MTKGWSLDTQLKALHCLNHLLVFYGLWLAVCNPLSTAWYLVAFTAFLFLGIVGVNIGYHRYFCHRSFTTSRAGDWILLVSTLPTCLGSPLAWCGIHRWHHANSDSQLDPHSPKYINGYRAWFMAWKPAVIPRQFVSDLIRDPRQKWIHKNYFRILFVIYLSLFLIDAKLVIFLIAVPAVGCFHGLGAVVSLCHLFGYRNHITNDESKNNALASLLSLGEGWHNNHHHDSRLWRHGEKWWEFDPPAFVIQWVFRRRDNEDHSNRHL